MTTLLSTRYSNRRVIALAVLGAGSAYALAMLAARVAYTGQGDLRFLRWNLFLAWLPLVAALALEWFDRRSARAGLLVAAAAVWLALYPNAPYIVTDFVHLRPRSGVPLWFDLLLIATFAWNGVMLGFASLAVCHRVARRRFGERWAWAGVALTSGLAGFGIYLGRFGRWNSWDVLTRPADLLVDVAGRVVFPASHPKTWAVTIAIGGFLFLTYAALHVIASLRSPRA